jgi:hypothetical protein
MIFASAKFACSRESSVLQSKPQASTQAAGKRLRSFVGRLGAIALSGQQSGSFSVLQSPRHIGALPFWRCRSSLNVSSRHLCHSLRNTAAMSVLQSLPAALVSPATAAVSRYRYRKRFIFTAAGSHALRSVMHAALGALRVLRYPRFSMPMHTPSPNQSVKRDAVKAASLRACLPARRPLLPR